jgi:hypothetical protein
MPPHTIVGDINQTYCRRIYYPIHLVIDGMFVFTTLYPRLRSRI